jgi:hypothetical protein
MNFIGLKHFSALNQLISLALITSMLLICFNFDQSLVFLSCTIFFKKISYSLANIRYIFLNKNYGDIYPPYDILVHIYTLNMSLLSVIQGYIVFFCVSTLPHTILTRYAFKST